MKRAGFSIAAVVVVVFSANAWTTVQAAEECVAKSIDQVGRCNKRGFAREIVKQQLEGVEQTPPAPPLGVDPDVLATQLWGEMAKGEMSPVKGGRGEWALIVRAAETHQEQSNRFELVAKPDSRGQLALVRWEAPRQGEGEKAIVRVIAIKEGRIGLLPVSKTPC